MEIEIVYCSDCRVCALIKAVLSFKVFNLLWLLGTQGTNVSLQVGTTSNLARITADSFKATTSQSHDR